MVRCTLNLQASHHRRIQWQVGALPLPPIDPSAPSEMSMLPLKCRFPPPRRMRVSAPCGRIWRQMCSFWRPFSKIKAIFLEFRKGEYSVQPLLWLMTPLDLCCDLPHATDRTDSDKCVLGKSSFRADARVRAVDSNYSCPATHEVTLSCRCGDFRHSGTQELFNNCGDLPDR